MKQQEIQSLQKAASNRKSRSKKTINLKIINAETYTTYYKQVKNKRANTQRKKKISNKQSPKPKRKVNNKREKKARSPSINNNKNDRLEEGIKLPIKKENEAVDDTVDNNNGVRIQLSMELQATIQPIRPARERRLPIRYR